MEESQIEPRDVYGRPLREGFYFRIETVEKTPQGSLIKIVNHGDKLKYEHYLGDDSGLITYRSRLQPLSEGDIATLLDKLTRDNFGSSIQRGGEKGPITT